MRIREMRFTNKKQYEIWEHRFFMNKNITEYSGCYEATLKCWVLRWESKH